MADAHGGWEAMARWMEREIGFRLESSRWYLYESAFRPLLRDRGLADAPALAAAADRDPALRQRCINAATINETLFFRDQHLWPDLAARILPLLMADCAFRGRINVLVCACARGQEVWSLAMTAAECRVPMSILATDVDTEALAAAQAGWYSGLEVGRGLGEERRSRFFDRDGEGWRVRPELRRDLLFQSMNLAAGFSFQQRFDLVLCRNVLIYFGLDLRQRILVRLAGCTANWGFLLLGGAESILGLATPWHVRRIGSTTVHQKTYGAGAGGPTAGGGPAGGRLAGT